MGYHKHLAQVNDRVGLIIMASVFTVAIITVVFLRFWARRLLKLRYGADDWLALTALVCFCLSPPPERERNGSSQQFYSVI